MTIAIVLGILFFYHLYISDRLKTLQYELDTLKRQRAVTARSATTMVDDEAAPTNFAPNTFSPHVAPLPTQISRADTVYVPPEPSAFVLWLKQDILVKVGALLLLIALGWFVSYAFANNWIGPIGRITLGILFGLGLMILGVIRITKVPNQGAIFTVLGSTTVILTLYAARGIYDFFTPASALAGMFLMVAFVAFVSVRYQREQLAIASLVLGAVAPLLTNAPTPDITGLSLYLLMLVVGTLWVVYITRSHVLTPLALGVVALYGLPLLAEPLSGDTLIGLFFTFVFVSLFFITNVLSMLSDRNQNRVGEQSQYLTAIGTGLYLLVWIFVAAPDMWQTPLYLIWMVVFSVGAFAVYTRTRDRLPFYIYGSVALCLLVAATANEFEGALLTIVYTVQLLSIVLIADTVVMNSSVARKLAWLFLPLTFVALQHFVSPAWQDGVLHSDFFASFIVMTALLVVGLKLNQGRTGTTQIDTISQTLLIFSGSYALILIWLVFHAVLATGPATAFSLVTYTIGGLIFYVTGRLESNKNMVTIGMALIAGVVVRLLVVDVWALQLEQRIILFFVIGVLLLSTAFIKKGTKTI